MDGSAKSNALSSSLSVVSRRSHASQPEPFSVLGLFLPDTSIDRRSPPTPALSIAGVSQKTLITGVYGRDWPEDVRRSARRIPKCYGAATSWYRYDNILSSRVLLKITQEPKVFGLRGRSSM